MSQKQYIVTLTADEREYLAGLVSSGKGSALSLTRARILLKADASPMGPSWDDARIAEAIEVSVSTVERTRQKFIRRGLKASLARKPQDRPNRRPRLDGRRLQELAHQSPRNLGKKRSTWTLQLLADTCSEIGIATGKVSDETVRRTLKRMGVTYRRAELWMTSPDPLYAQKKARRDQFIRLAEKHPEWVVGFVDEVWWSRLARPPLRAWSAGDPLKLHVLSRRDDDPDPSRSAATASSGRTPAE
jgi:transposase